MVFQFTSWHLTLGGIERSNQGHLVFIGMCIILNVLLDSGAVRPRGLLFKLNDVGSEITRPRIRNISLHKSIIVWTFCDFPITFNIPERLFHRCYRTTGTLVGMKPYRTALHTRPITHERNTCPTYMTSSNGAVTMQAPHSMHRAAAGSDASLISSSLEWLRQQRPTYILYSRHSIPILHRIL